MLRTADVVVISKTDSAPAESIRRAVAIAAEINPRAAIVLGRSEITLDAPQTLRGRRALVVEDGPTLTHGGMSVGAGAIAARAAGAELVDPRPYAPPELQRTLARYPQLGPVLPALGYGDADLELLARTIAATPADVVVAGTPLDLARLLPSGKAVVRARYRFTEAEPGALAGRLDEFLREVAQQRGQ